MATNSGSKDGRSRNWTWIVYPESAPEDWRDLLDEEHFQWIESPLHDKDLNPTGEAKKAHIHVTAAFQNKKSYEQVLSIAKKVNGTIPQVVHDLKSMVRYLVHLDNPSKYQYDTSDIIAHGGFEFKDYLLTSTGKYDAIRDMMIYIVDNQITEFWKFMDCCRQFHYDDWFPYLCDNSAFVINLFIKSYRYDPEGAAAYLEDHKPIDNNPEELPI